MSTDRMITATATASVTPITSVIPKRSQALEYQSVEKVSGSHVVNHDLPRESTMTLTRMPIRKMKNAAAPAHTTHVLGEATSDRSPGGTPGFGRLRLRGAVTVSYTHLRAHETRHDLVCRLLLEK